MKQKMMLVRTEPAQQSPWIPTAPMKGHVATDTQHIQPKQEKRPNQKSPPVEISHQSLSIHSVALEDTKMRLMLDGRRALN